MNDLKKHELDRLAYGTASQTLDDNDQNLVDSFANKNENFNQRLTYWQDILAGLDNAAGQAIPPAHIWANIENQIRSETGQTSIPSTPISRRPWWQTLAMAASIALFGLLVFLQSPPEITSVNLDDQWIVQVDQGANPLTLTIEATDPMAVPAGMVCNLWFKSGDTVVGVAQMPLQGNITLDLKGNPQLRELLSQPGTLMVTVDAADAGLEVMYNQSMINGKWL